MQPSMVQNSLVLSLVPSSRAFKSVDTFTHTRGQTSHVPDCMESRLTLLRGKQVFGGSSRKSPGDRVTIYKHLVQSNTFRNEGRNSLCTRVKYACRAGRDEGREGCCRKAGAEWQVEAGPNTNVFISKPSETSRLFIFGFGYTSSALAFGIKDKKWNVTGTCRRSDDRSVLEECGFHTVLFNSENDGEELNDYGLQELQRATHWLISIPPVGDFDNDPVLAVHKEDLIQAAARGNVRWIGYLSSTGVYGDWQGSWVDEDTEPRPVEQKAVARLAAEDDWLSFGKAHGVAVQVFRLGGIYGAGRSALNSILQYRTRSGPQRERRRFTSRIHVADVCQVLSASMGHPCPGRIYNVVDDDPAPRREVFAFARDLLGLQAKDTEATEEVVKYGDLNSSTIYSTQCEEKRVSNRRIKEELHIQLLYPSYKSGLQAIWEIS
ncbi:hypothetical protein Mapa_009889 [Marchantia paleacea]|nr:hypothetical protein Mapa_009889 [Marchantia paleacea]